jgi:mlo protein
VGAKLQHVIATLALENAGFSQYGRFAGIAGTVKPRDELFWFKKPQLVLGLILFVLFQNAFEMATLLSFLVSAFILS